MCGIAGAHDLTHQNRIDPTLVRQMTALITHRGPDGDGFYDTHSLSMGMRRLSIIDVDGSDQPLYNEDKSIALVFNGEIYNYRELQAQLIEQGHNLRTDGDGETIIHLYEQYGVDCFRYLRGMYAIALWDSSQERLILAIDHIGMKPLYLYQADGCLYFASEIKSLFAKQAIQPSLNMAVVDSYLSFGYPIGEQTLFEGITRLMPGHMLIAQSGHVTIDRYWQFGNNFDLDSQPATSNTQSAETIIAAVRNQLRESVRLHLRSDVPLGLFLSGGIDSAAMLALMSEEAQGRVKTYTVGFDSGTDGELLQARRIAKHFQTDHIERIITPQDWWQGLEEYAYYHDEPNANPSAISMMLLAEETAKHVKVVLTGLGGDELFGGYPYHRTIPQLLEHQWHKLPAGQMLANALGWLEKFYPTFKRYRIIGAIPTYAPRLRHHLMPANEGIRRVMSFDGMVLSDTMRRYLYSDALHTAWQSLQYKENTFQTILEQSYQADGAHTAQALVVNTWLMGNALLSQDKVTMAHSLEARVPFFDPKLFAQAATLPSHLLLKSNKHILREAVRGIVPDFALNRAKQPFYTPIRGWFEHDLKSNIQAVLRDDNAISRELFDTQYLDNLLNKHFNGEQKQEEVIFRLLNLELWHRAFIRDKRPTQILEQST